MHKTSVELCVGWHIQEILPASLATLFETVSICNVLQKSENYQQDRKSQISLKLSREIHSFEEEF